MAKRKVPSRTVRRSRKAPKRVVKRPAAKKISRKTRKKAAKARSTPARPAKRTRAARVRPKAKAKARPKRPARQEVAHREATRLNRPRRQLEEVVPSPPSSLDMDRHASAARSGRAEAAGQRANRASLTPSITAGDADVNIEDAYFTGDESPGGDNSTPDQDVVDDIGKAIGVEYQDDEELRGSDKVSDRDKHRWELDPASSEDYRERKKEKS
jgi:hypothetical protein